MKKIYSILAGIIIFGNHVQAMEIEQVKNSLQKDFQKKCELSEWGGEIFQQKKSLHNWHSGIGSKPLWAYPYDLDSYAKKDPEAASFELHSFSLVSSNKSESLVVFGTLSRLGDESEKHSNRIIVSSSDGTGIFKKHQIIHPDVDLLECTNPITGVTLSYDKTQLLVATESTDPLKLSLYVYGLKNVHVNVLSPGRKVPSCAIPKVNTFRIFDGDATEIALLAYGKGFVRTWHESLK